MAKQPRSVDTRNVILRAGYSIARLRGLAAVTHVSVAELISLTSGAVQGHYRLAEELRLAVVDWWAAEVRSRILDQGQSRGLNGAWELAERAILLAASLRVPFDALVGPARGRVRVGLLSWVEQLETRLLQAEYLGEIRVGTDLRLLARRACRVLWSEQLVGDLIDPQEAALEAAKATWALLASGAKDPVHDLPSLVERLEEIRLRIPSRPPPDDARNSVGYRDDEPMFRDLLELTDPLRHAFERTTRLGEDYSFIRLPPITEADLAAAKEVERRIAAGLPAVPPQLL